VQGRGAGEGGQHGVVCQSVMCEGGRDGEEGVEDGFEGVGV